MQQGELGLAFGALAAAAARGAPVAAPVPGSCCSVFCSSGQYLGGGYLLREVLQPSPPMAPLCSGHLPRKLLQPSPSIVLLQRCRRAFAALAALHAQGFPHGDARLPNLLQRSGGSGELLWIDLRPPAPDAVAYAADREALAASVLGARRGGEVRGLVADALDAAAAASRSAASYDALARVVYEALVRG